jgi:hypothetical protein
MGLDDDRIDDPDYRPRAHWRPVSRGTPPRCVGGQARLPSRRAETRGHRHEWHGR